MKTKVIDILKNLLLLIYKKVLKPIKKYFKKRRYLKKLKMKHELTGEIIEGFEPLLKRLIHETLIEYDLRPGQSHYTRQAQIDIREIYEKKIETFYRSNKSVTM